MKKKSESESKSSGVGRRTFLAGTATAAGAGILSSFSPHLTRPAGAATVIPKRPFGRTGVEVTVVGVGCGSRFYGPIPDDESAAELVRRAIDRGIGVVETSANYGDGVSEKRIGLAMKTHRSQVFLETKIDARDYDGALAEMERSMKRMNTDYLDLVLHHFIRSPEMLDEVASSSGAERAIRKLVDEKVVRFRGLSTHLPNLALDGMDRLEPDAIQLPLNAVRVPDFEPEVLPKASSSGVAVIAMKTCGNGFFFRPNATKPDRFEEFGPPPEVYEQWELPTPKEYIHYSLSLPVATAVIGIDSFFTLDGVISAATEFNGPLTAEHMASITQRAQVFKTTGYWIPRG